MTTATLIRAEVADRIAGRVLTKTYLKSCGGLDLVRMCACQYGRCGHCGMGQHDKCTTRVGFHNRPPLEAHTHIVGRRGSALAAVRTTGTPCRWVCPCTACAQPEPASEQRPEAVAYRRVRGELRPGDTVWLHPRTLTSPAVCWQQPRATVVRTERASLYAVVQVGQAEHRIHVDNIRRTDPGAAHGVVQVKAKPRPAMPDGFEETPLF
ncbi:DUF6248 family natural product biosynthesis protein [Couchioplanes caeruleus]|nr:DUF6248 family natural product biosynthesis protein [Couchioplanes caeruleus]ROP29526.1 hypothetical protein EDD30_2324 [Couchioplanes caeruleus]